MSKSKKDLEKELKQLEKQLLELEVTDRKDDEGELLDLLEEESYFKAIESSYNFLMYSWNTFETVEFKQSKHLQAIGEHLDACASGEIKKLIINIQPRNSKTAITSKAFPAFLWIKEPEKKIINLSYSASLSVKDSVASRQIMSSDWYQKGLKNIWKGIQGLENTWDFSKDTNQKHDYENTFGGRRYATSIFGSVYGAGGDYLLVDDPLNPKELHGRQMVSKTNEMLSNIFSTRLNDRKTGVRILIAQRLCKGDSTDYFLSEGGWEHLCIPTEWDETQRYFTSIGWTDWRTKDKELMNPERFPRSVIEDLKIELGEYNYAAQCQQKPTPKGGGLIKEDWFSTWWVLPSYFDSAVIAIDLNEKEGINNDNTALIVMGKKDNSFYIIDLIYGNMDIVKQLNEITNLCDKYKFINNVLIEDKGGGSQVYRLLKEFIPGLRTVSPNGISKHTRIGVTIPYIDKKRVYIPDKKIHSFIEPFLSECVSFPKGKYDDALDAFAYGLEYLLVNHSITKMQADIITEGENTTSRNELRNTLLSNDYNIVNNSNSYIRGLLNG